MNFGKKLKELRGKRTQQSISEKLNVSRASYSHYENGHVEPSIDILRNISEIYQVSLDYLLETNNNTFKQQKLDKVLNNLIQLSFKESLDDEVKIEISNVILNLNSLKQII